VEELTHVEWTLTANAFLQFLTGCRDRLVRYETLLNDLDNRIGDGDHGTNMARGFRTAVAEANAGSADLGALANGVAIALLGSVGGASGPLYGTAFMRLGMQWKGFQAISERQFVDGLQAACDGIRARGRAEVGDKTMVDVWQPATDTLRTGQGALDARLRTAVQTAQQQALQSRLLTARKGRAAYLGERSVGTCDPGCISSAILFEELFSATTGGDERLEWDTSVL
jgi:dihydroxyacetone kinase-like protein